MRPWESPCTSKDKAWHDVKIDMDKLFGGLEHTLVLTPHLREFTCRDVPRVLDLLVLLQRNWQVIHI